LIKKVDGFTPGANAYLYAVMLVRVFDGTTWCYADKTTSGEEGLETQLEKHIRGKNEEPGTPK
jgi:hypothetical protein